MNLFNSFNKITTKISNFVSEKIEKLVSSKKESYEEKNNNSEGSFCFMPRSFFQFAEEIGVSTTPDEIKYPIKLELCHYMPVFRKDDPTGGAGALITAAPEIVATSRVALTA